MFLFIFFKLKNKNLKITKIKLKKKNCHTRGGVATGTSALINWNLS